MRPDGSLENITTTQRPMKQHLVPFRNTLAVLVAALGLGLPAVLAQSYLMPANTPVDSNPGSPNSNTRKVLTYGVDADGNTVPVKTLRITNNTDQTVYPIMRDPNSTVVSSSTNTGLYDPYDKPNMEYRGYIGYAEGSGTGAKHYFGLKPRQSILVSVPLVFWNGGRVGLGTDGTYLTPVKGPNPLNYDPNATRAIAPALSDSRSIANGVVMWYRSGIAKGPAPDAADQLAEWTFRDHNYLNNQAITNRTKGQIPDNQLVTLANLDVSFVDSLYLPLAFEATDVWVVPQSTGPAGNRTQWTPGSDPQPFGWTGATNTIDYLQERIQAFTALPANGGTNALLGNYFGGKGWPFYNVPNPTNNPKAPQKIPAGAAIFPQSPLLGTASSYNDGTWQSNKYMLSSGGTAAINTTIGWAGGTPDPEGSTTLHVLRDAPQQFSFIQVGDAITGNPPATKPPTKNPIAPGTTVLAVHPESSSVTLSTALVSSSAASSYTFTRPVDDYAADAIIRLWYSWAEYYLEHWKDNNPLAPTAPKQIQGSMDAESASIRFEEAHPELVEGMMVQGPGLDSAQTEVGPHQGNALILRIASDQKSVIVSQVANKPSSNASFTFSPPQRLLYTPQKKGDPGFPLITNFQFAEIQDYRKPYEFARTVYKIMASMNQIGKADNNNVCKFMEDIIGANMAYIFDQKGKDSVDGQMVIAMIRDDIKSVLRGVSDFTLYPDKLDAQGNHIVWYPHPAEHQGGQNFNVFNLDPFVWFVHVQLGFSGYGFSVDDDTADIGAGGAGHLEVAVTGTAGLTNTNQWFIQAPYGPLVNISCEYSGTTSGDTLYNAISNVSATTPIKITSPGQINLKNDEIIVIDQVQGVPAAIGTFKIGNVSTHSFELFDEKTGAPIAGSGTYVANTGRWSYPLHPYIDTGADLTRVFYKVTGDDALGTFQGTPVSVDNEVTKKGEKIRVWQLGQQKTGRLLLNAPILNADGTALLPGTYNFTFSGTYIDK